MEFDAVTIVILVGVAAVLILALASGRRSVDQAGADAPRSRWLGTAAWLGIFGASSGASHTDGDSRVGDDHGVGGDWSGPGGGDYGGGGWGGSDFGGGGDGGGGGGGGGGGD